MTSKEKIKIYGRLRLVGLAFLVLCVLVFLFAYFSISGSKLQMYYNEQSAKPNYEQKVQSTNDTQQKSTDPNKDYAPQDNNKVNPSQTPDNSFIYDTQISDLL